MTWSERHWGWMDQVVAVDSGLGLVFCKRQGRKLPESATLGIYTSPGWAGTRNQLCLIWAGKAGSLSLGLSFYTPFSMPLSCHSALFLLHPSFGFFLSPRCSPKQTSSPFSSPIPISSSHSLCPPSLVACPLGMLISIPDLINSVAN